MAAPSIVISNETPVGSLAAGALSGAWDGSNLNLSTLTCANGVWTDLQGATGADWCAGGGTDYVKREGGNQLVSVTNGPGAFSGSPFVCVWTSGLNTLLPTGTGPGDDKVLGSQRNSYNGMSGIAATNTSHYMEFSAIVADQKQRSFHWQGRNDEGASTYQVTATFSDGSATATPMTLVNNVAGFTNPTGFKIVFTAATTCLMTVRITCSFKASTGFADNAYLMMIAAWLEVPVDAPVPRGGRRYLQFLGRSGGANA